MKYLKLFNEELNPNTYRRAANRLSYYNKTTRSSALHDYADEKEFGFYNMTFGNNENSSSFVVNQKFTNPKLSRIYYGKNSEANILSYGVDGENEAESLVNKWVQGSDSGYDSLSITFEFSFTPTREAFKTSKFGSKNDYPIPVSAFSIELDMSHWYEGIDSWDSESKWQAEIEGEEFTPSNVHDFYENSKSFCLYLRSPLIKGNQYYGIFSDKKSAVKFKNWLLVQLNGDIKDSIMNILRLVNGNDLDTIEKQFKDIKIVGLYDDEELTSRTFTSSKPSKRWFDKELT